MKTITVPKAWIEGLMKETERLHGKKVHDSDTAMAVQRLIGYIDSARHLLQDSEEKE